MTKHFEYKMTNGKPIYRPAATIPTPAACVIDSTCCRTLVLQFATCGKHSTGYNTEFSPHAAELSFSAGSQVCYFRALSTAPEILDLSDPVILVILLILKNLEAVDLCAVAGASRRMRALAKDLSLWKNVVVEIPHKVRCRD